MTSATIRAAAGPDQVAVERVVRTAFGDEGAAIVEVLRALADRGLLRATLVAEDRGTAVGVVGLSAAWLDARDRVVDVWLLAPLATLPAHQGRGLGTALMAAALELARADDVPAVFLEGDPDFYGRRGFEPGERLGCEAPSRRIPGPAFQIAPLDRWAPEMSGRLVYPDVWWQHDLVGLRDPELAELEKRFVSE